MSAKAVRSRMGPRICLDVYAIGQPLISAQGRACLQGGSAMDGTRSSVSTHSSVSVSTLTHSSMSNGAESADAPPPAGVGAGRAGPRSWAREAAAGQQAADNQPLAPRSRCVRVRMCGCVGVFVLQEGLS